MLYQHSTNPKTHLSILFHLIYMIWVITFNIDMGPVALAESIQRRAPGDWEFDSQSRQTNVLYNLYLSIPRLVVSINRIGRVLDSSMSR